MKLHRNTVVVCLLVVVCLPAGLSNPLLSQNGPQARKVNPQQEGDGCAKPRNNKCVDLCSLARLMRSKTQARLKLESLDHKKTMLLPEHVDVTLVANQDQVVWTCDGLPKNQTFQITKIMRVLKPPDPNADQPNSRPESPFCSDIPTSIMHGGGRLYSGTPRKAAIGQWYKYSFRVNTTDYDPHLIVTGGPPEPRPYGSRPYGCPSVPDHDPKSGNDVKSKD
jgi:hypothetical protein